MNNLKKAGVMALIATLTITMVLAPFTPMTQIQPVATPEYATPEEVLMDIERYVDTKKEGGPLGSILANYRDTNFVPRNVARNDVGDVGLLVTVRTDSDMAHLGAIIDVSWKVEIGAMTIASGFVKSPEAVTELENFDGIVTAFADALNKEKTRDILPKPAVFAAPPTTEPDAYAIIPEIGADQVWAAGYNGTGVTVAVSDTGVDFGHPELVGTMDIGSDGLSTSFDPTGEGFVISLYRANSTVVDPDAYLAFSSWNVLSYQDAGKWYINWTTTHKGPQARDLKINGEGYYDDLDDYHYEAHMAAWYPGAPGYSYPGNVTAMTEYYYNTIRADPEIPDPSLSQGGPQLNITLNATLGTWQMVPYYTAGYAMQQRTNPGLRVFAPVLVLNGTKIIVDWNTTRAHTDFWNLNVYWETYDFGDPATIARYDSLIDSSFVDDWEAGLYYTPDGTEEHLNMYYDYPDGAGRFSLGTLAHVWEYIIFGLRMVDGIGLSGRALAITFDGDGHGTFVSGEIAGQGVFSYPVGTNGTLHTLPGIAPGAKIMATVTIGISGSFADMLWTAGFDYNSSSGYYEWNADSVHQAQISSNSWGNRIPQYWALEGTYGLIYAALATPGFFNATHYPGQVICFSSGNSGPGYGSAGPPQAAQIISVGASTSYHTFNDAYGPGQGFDQVADFSSRGPLVLGYAKPDVVAPGRNNWGVQLSHDEVFLGVNDLYSLNAGTSMSCPLAAGLAALMLDADSALKPDMVKAIMQSTADDTGMDGLAQGHGVINAWAAIDFIVNNEGYSFYSYDSVANWGTATAEAWKAGMNPYTYETFSNTSTPPGNFADGNLYFGLVDASDTVTMTVQGANWAYGDAGWSWSAMQYVAGQTTTFGFDTWIYNETTSTGSDYTLAGYMLLNTSMETASPGSYANFQGANYATISITGDQATFEDDSMHAFVFDWNDNDPANGIPDYYNETNDTGDELTRWQYAGGTGNVLKIDLSYPGGLGNLFPNQPIISVHDDNIWSWPFTTGNTLEVTVQSWTLAADGNIGFADNAGNTDVTLTFPGTPDYGIHQGFVIANNGTDLFKMPYTYNVFATYDTADTVLEIAEGVGAVQTPYEHGTVTAGFDAYYHLASADHMSFVVNMTDATVTSLAARINWTNSDTDMDVAIVDMTGFELAHSGTAVKSTTDSSLAIVSSGVTPGMYIIYTTVNELEGGVPEDFTLTFVGLTTLDEPTLELSWTSADSPTPTVVTAGGTAAGDHVVLKAAWTDGVNPGMPEFGITTIEMNMLFGNLFVATGPHVDPTDVSQFGGFIDPAQFAWETVPDVVTGDNVRAVCAITGSDVDVMVWWADTPMEERGYATNLMGDQMAGPDLPERGSFIATRDGDLSFGILNYGDDGGTYTLTVDTRGGFEGGLVSAKEFEMETYELEGNTTVSVSVDSFTGTNIRYTIENADILVANYFAPVVTVNAPVDLGSDLWNFTWSSTDINQDDTHYYSVWLSSDGGNTFMILGQNMTETSLVWNDNGWLIQDYMYRVRAYDLDFVYLDDGVSLNAVDEPPTSYWPGLTGDAVSAPFEAGNVVYTPPVTTTTTTTTTTPTPTPTPTPTTIDPLLIGLLGGLGVGVVILLILFLIRKK